MKFNRLTTCSAFALLFTIWVTTPAAHAEPGQDEVPLGPGLRTTFPGTRIIYRAAGAFDSGDTVDTGTATTVTCKNFSKNVANVVVQFFDAIHTKVGEGTFAQNPNDGDTVSTHGTFLGELLLNTGSFDRGTVIIRSNESAVFCSATVVNAAGPAGGYALHMVRFRKHKGAEE